MSFHNTLSTNHNWQKNQIIKRHFYACRTLGRWWTFDVLANWQVSNFCYSVQLELEHWRNNPMDWTTGSSERNSIKGVINNNCLKFYCQTNVLRPIKKCVLSHTCVVGSSCPGIRPRGQNKRKSISWHSKSTSS